MKINIIITIITIITIIMVVSLMTHQSIPTGNFSRKTWQCRWRRQWDLERCWRSPGDFSFWRLRRGAKKTISGKYVLRIFRVFMLAIFLGFYDLEVVYMDKELRADFLVMVCTLWKSNVSLWWTTQSKSIDRGLSNETWRFNETG